jgi:hypothetical protein
MIHDFAQSLAASHAQADASWWLDVYRRAFPAMRAAVSVRDDGWAQRGGIDRVITLSSGRTITVDEKVREKDWPDILLERWSDEARETPGWIQKPLACDFIAYAFIPSRTCYLLPTLTLQAAWRLYGREWIEKYRTVRAKNDGWVTASIPVPRDVLLSSLSDAMRVEWNLVTEESAA